jgi:hypothetical protein
MTERDSELTGGRAGPVTGLARAVTGAARAACEGSRMSLFTEVAISGMALVRISIGAAPFVAAAPVSRMLGFPSSHDNPSARLMSRFFGVRDIGLGVLALWGLRHPEALPFILLFNAFMDAGDLVSTAIPLVKRQGIDRGAATSALFALVGGLSWLIMWAIAR